MKCSSPREPVLRFHSLLCSSSPSAIKTIECFRASYCQKIGLPPECLHLAGRQSKALFSLVQLPSAFPEGSGSEGLLTWLTHSALSWLALLLAAQPSSEEVMLCSNRSMPYCTTL